MMDAALQRKNMVENQVRTSDVTDRRITAAMLALPRERFLPGHLAGVAYSDEDLTIGSGQLMLAPRVLAKLVQLAEVEESNRVLVIGGYCGYAAAVVSRLAAHVVALCPDEKSLDAAEAALRSLEISNVSVAKGSLASGWPDKAPYDVILIEGGVEAVPEALEAQIAEGGRLVAVSVDPGIGCAFQLQKCNGYVTRREAFQAGAPLLPGFEAHKPAFVF
jgi:protein-L-isoaspartate(D-aspartate) O-methyltransferase